MKHEINDGVYSRFVSKLVSNNYQIDSFELGQFQEILRNMSVLSQQADKLKREIFYVKTQHNSTSLNSVEIDALHGVLGLISEVDELIKAVFVEHHHVSFSSPAFLEPPLMLKAQSDRGNVNEEVGDSLFYLSMIQSCFGLNLNDAKFTNMKKLSARYSKLAFTSEEALELRDIANELQIINTSTEE